MNKNLNNAMFEREKADALLASIEALYMDFDFLPEEKEKAERGAYAFYAVWDMVKKATECLDNYTAECRIVDVLTAVREANNI